MNFSVFSLYKTGLFQTRYTLIVFEVLRFFRMDFKTGVVIANLGTPGSPRPEDVGRYLSEFLMDPNVIQIPGWARVLLVQGIIVPFRKKKSGTNYKKIWTSKGSPLLVETRKMAQALQRELGQDYLVTVAMRYGEPGFAQARRELKACKKVIFFPQYPQYARSTTQSSLDEFYRFFPKETSRVIGPYYEDPEFINASIRFLKTRLQSLDFDYLLMSFHGLPVSHIHRMDPTGGHCLHQSCLKTHGGSHLKKRRNSNMIGTIAKKIWSTPTNAGKYPGATEAPSKNLVWNTSSKTPFISDPMDCCKTAPKEVLKICYRAQCFRSAQALADGLNLSNYGVSFQSRLGWQRWIKPYTEDIYGELITRGIKKLAVVCPGFSVDGLETLYEIAIEGRKIFLKKGGIDFSFIPCLNSEPHWIKACGRIIKNKSS